MQQLFVVQGKPTWSGQMAIALVNGCGRYTPLKFVFVGKEGDDSYGCYATATEKATGEIINGSLVDISLAKKEGWYGKSGSKWQTMPTQMLLYRAGAFFARVYCPDVLLGLPMVEEMKDVFGYEERK